LAVYFDNAATSYPKPKAVYEAVDFFQRQVGASPGRGTYQKSREADRIIFETRSALAALFNIPDLSRIVFTPNVTESINLALKGYLQTGSHVITTSMEHNAVWRPLKGLEQKGDIKISLLSCPSGMAYNPDQLTGLIKSNTTLVVINHASNVTGTIMPLEETGKICRMHNIPLLVDAAQTAGIYPIDVQLAGIDLLAFTGHKGLMGPPGTGGLYIREGIDLVPLKEGGTGSESLLEAQPAHLPDRFEAGTLNGPGIAGLGAGVKFILDQGLEKIRQHEVELTEYALLKLKQLSDIVIYGPQDANSRTAVISFNFTNIAPEEVTYVFDEVYNIMARSGLHCAPQAHRAIETVELNGTVRISFGCFNTLAEIDFLISALEDLANA
jgi:cysteine desulfurase family protein